MENKWNTHNNKYDFPSSSSGTVKTRRWWWPGWLTTAASLRRWASVTRHSVAPAATAASSDLMADPEFPTTPTWLLKVCKCDRRGEIKGMERQQRSTHFITMYAAKWDCFFWKWETSPGCLCRCVHVWLRPIRAVRELRMEYWKDFQKVGTHNESSLFMFLICFSFKLWRRSKHFRCLLKKLFLPQLIHKCTSLLFWKISGTLFHQKKCVK